MGMRTGDIDPSFIGYLMRSERVGIEQVSEKSGSMFGI